MGPDKTGAMKALVKRHADPLADGALDPGELAAWTVLANQLMNLDEVLNK